MCPPTELVDYRDWVGREEIVEDTISLGAVRGLLATLDDTETQLNQGDPLPPLWHWLSFLPQAPLSRLGHDGHPLRGDFLPPVELPRRMFAGGSLTFHEPISIGMKARRVGRVAEVTHKEGRSGPLVLVTVVYQILDGDRLCVEETQTIVYREAGAPIEAPTPGLLPTLPRDPWVRDVTPTAVLLFRFSALTFNSHRIHYDRPYVMAEEGYPGLVVQGPLIAIHLLELVRANTRRRVASFQFRAVAPIFDTAPFRIVGRVSDAASVDLTALRCDGEVAVTAHADLV